MSFKSMPVPPRLRSIIGPSFLILAMGLGSGEVILWPYLVANYGLGIAWAAIFGITLQFFINMEIERYALVTGESVFYGYRKLWKWLPVWFIVSTFVGFGLPGIVASSAYVFKDLFNINVDLSIIGSILLILIGIILSIGKTVYKLMEKLTQVIIVFGVLIILFLVIYFSKASDWGALANGLVGMGEGFWWIPAGIVFTSFFSAFAYSGAGGNLNLTQSIYIREKGYGMGFYSAKMSGLFRKTKDHQEIDLAGNKMEITADNLVAYKKWWRLVNYEHAVVFWFIGSFAILLLMLLSYITVFGQESVSKGISFVLLQGQMISSVSSPMIGSLFLFAVGMMLLQTQLGVIDSISRIIAENIALLKIKDNKTKINIGKIYYMAVWALIAFGISLFLMGNFEPKFLLVLAGVINGCCMSVHILLTYILNKKALPAECQPNIFRQIVIIGSFLVFLAFGVFSIFQVLK
jgi:Mn2+/Fe2+ NRAMP family transporter